MPWCLELVAEEDLSAHDRQEAGKDSGSEITYPQALRPVT